MGQQQSSPNGSSQAPKDQQEKNLNLKKKKRMRGAETLSKLPTVYPQSKCMLRQIKLEKIRDYFMLEEGILSYFNSSSEKEGEEKFVTERDEVDRFRGYPMNLGTLEEFIDEDHAIISTSSGQEYYVPIYSFVDKDALEPGCTVLLNHRESGVVGVLEGETDPLVSVMKLEKAPVETYADIGGLEHQIQEIKEAVELPLTNPELYDEMGIKPPKGVILYGEPGTGKTLLAKAVANQTSATFLRIVGSELIQKYLGDGPKLVRELFKAAEMYAPTIIFIDEIDAIGAKRYDTNSSGEKEIERTMLELLNQLDGFDTSSDIKVIMATNKIESLDPALIRPGRIDRKIEFPVPDIQTKRKIFGIHTTRMTLSKEVVLDDMIGTNEDLSGADIKAICTEAGMLALRERRKQVTMQDFTKAKEKVQATKLEAMPTSLYA
ncbi:26S proteasome regulatory subunit T2 [Nematocida parisii]|uniref:26S proteasome regulatory subunit 4 homolog n=1 Tax=Nematocida parisii (strain ERTm3) TaxID=935791 RepID=I3EED0_NEMP3|nr:proteasome 26S ATPase subunit 1 [Nematocida parisii ERTm1]EIJ87577.1 proteasome 26S ATPase subunit 1 [Nematocida parisii ERTm3]KAI5129097.1 26S proteasome regulatory subunit T2 [Nematocida parisii]KAI5166113.1 26S proteasome regulatory subunit T2 [Nematocida sp. AWRm79]KAI5183292.1 26S proteasome regulatory subunit T2 [Nematocida sp. AWRm78]OAG33465.1 26S proteasome regulatory subunit T2 [Nematocida sp. ERTm5]|eukprot:XP_013060030.1 proteasome 26S ATPase subunit 1 [Nematocida parisii ERTm1]